MAPELLWSQTVFVGDEPKSVVALVFDTSDFPYVINGDNRREIPIRVASGTESAHRNQVVRMFEPSLHVPAMAITRAVVTSEWVDSPQQPDDSDPPQTLRALGLSLDLHASVLIEHIGAQPTTLPVKAMRARLTCTGFEVRPEVKVRHLNDTLRNRVGSAIRADVQNAPTPPQFGVYALNQQVIATAPGEFRIVASHTFPYAYAPDDQMSDYYDALAATEEMQFDLALRVGGVSRTVKLSAALARTAQLENKKPTNGQFGNVLRASLGKWELISMDEDPWQ